jgi:hypothetical protein
VIIGATDTSADADFFNAVLTSKPTKIITQATLNYADEGEI